MIFLKVRQRSHQNSLFGHIGDEISRNMQKKKETALQGGHETQFSSKFGAKLSLACPFLTPSNQSLLLLCVL
jgi:hypothetical protein